VKKKNKDLCVGNKKMGNKSRRNFRFCTPRAILKRISESAVPEVVFTREEKIAHGVERRRQEQV
jgi:hypothetical protein